MPKIITIDGTPAAGKSTMARMLANALGFYHLESGAIFRSIALACILNKIEPTEHEKIYELLTKLDIQLSNGSILLNGFEVSKAIRDPYITNRTSLISGLPHVREFARKIQTTTSEKYDIIIDGRDTGTKVFPHADIKYYLFADFDVRAWRRFRDFLAVNPHSTFEAVSRDLYQREMLERANNILRCPPDAILLDTTELNVRENFEVMYNKIKTLL